MAETVEGANIKVTHEEGDTVWKIRQADPSDSPPSSDSASAIDIDWSFGPVKISGYVDRDTMEIGTSNSVLGIFMGNTIGNLKDGVGLDINLFLAAGQMKYYLKNGNEVWFHLDIKVKFDGTFQGDYKIVTI